VDAASERRARAVVQEGGRGCAGLVGATQRAQEHDAFRLALLDEHAGWVPRAVLVEQREGARGAARAERRIGAPQ
jgi:hypothetical protein